MNSKERMRRAMAGERPDRVPVMCQLSLGHLIKNTGIDPVEFWFTSEGLAQAYIEMAERYRFDGILVNTYGRDPATRRRIRSVEPYERGHRITLNSGDEFYAPPDDDLRRIKGAPYPARPTHIDDIDLNAIPLRTDRGQLPAHTFDLLGLVLRQRGATMSVHGEVGTVFERLLVLFESYGDGLVALLDDPDKCKRIMDRMNRSVVMEAVEQCKMGIDVLKLSSPFAGAGFISRDMYREFVLPYEREVIAAANHCGVPCYIHTCGHIGDRLDLMAETGTQGLECLDPPPLGSVDLATAVRQVGDRVFFKGNLDSVNELLFQTPKEVLDIARKRIEIGKANPRGFILSTACSVAPGVPPENMLKLHEAVEAYGRYQV